MKMSARFYLAALCFAAVTASGCRRNIVSAAAPPSVATPPQPSAMPQPLPSEPVETASTPAPEPAPSEPATSPAMGIQPPPAPAPPSAGPVTPKPEPEAPQISPALSPGQLADAQRLTADDIRVAERNLQLSNGKTLNASQNDLADKVRGFLAQAHEAVRANDWLRAENLAHKAQVLSAELIKAL
jgi:hypothetical protein